MVAERSVPERAVDSPAKAFCLEGDPKAVSSTAHRTEQAPAPAREHGHFVCVRMNVSKTTGPSETGGQALRTQCINGSFQNDSPLRNEGAKHCVRSAKNQLDRGPLTTPKPPLAVNCPSETTAPSKTKGLSVSDGVHRGSLDPLHIKKSWIGDH